MKNIDIKENSEISLMLWGTHIITIKRNESKNGEIVIQQRDPHRLTHRNATEPYCCRLHFIDGSFRDVDLANEMHWGNIQQCDPDDCEDWENSIGWGNDEDGHLKIVKVTCDDYGEEVEIPMDTFKQDVSDLITRYSDC